MLVFTINFVNGEIIICLRSEIRMVRRVRQLAVGMETSSRHPTSITKIHIFSFAENKFPLCLIINSFTISASKLNSSISSILKMLC